VAPGTGILFDDESNRASKGRSREFTRLRFDPERLRRHAQTFDRAVYRTRMERRCRTPAKRFRIVTSTARRGAGRGGLRGANKYAIISYLNCFVVK
jgi:hypothetical protein